MSIFRIHGDNIVECERIARLIFEELAPNSIATTLMSPSTIVIELSFSYLGNDYQWHLELLPGFNKAGRHRWSGNIFDALRNSGSFLDETPDAIITSVHDGEETIICAIEFCSALQAGNQAWQRSGRAFSTGRTGCPYLYIVDFVKFELDISNNNKHLILCLIKGFKPGGDDNRPDRGLLPLATMLSAADVDTMTYLYGPVIHNNYRSLLDRPRRLANSNLKL